MTEEVTGVDLVRAQLEIAQGKRLADIGLDQKSIPAPRGIAVQLRVNMETMVADGSVRPAGGMLTAFEAPIGPGIRVDAFGYAGYATNPRFDSLLAKVIVHTKSGELADVARRAYRALSEFRIVGVAGNIPVLQALLQHPDFQRGAFRYPFRRRPSRRAPQIGEASDEILRTAGGGVAAGKARRRARRQPRSAGGAGSWALRRRAVGRRWRCDC